MNQQQKNPKKGDRSDQGKNKSSNTTLIIILVVVGILIILGVAAKYACNWAGDQIKKKTTQEAVEKAVEQKTGGNVEVGEESWPSDLPEELRYSHDEDIAVESSTSYEKEGQKVTSVTLTTDHPISSIYYFYRDGLPAQGWEIGYKNRVIKDEKDAEESAAVSAKKDNLSAMISVTKTSSEKTQISIQVNRSQE